MIHQFSFHLHDVAPYINWQYFFHAWGFPARLGSIAKVHGCEACRTNWLHSFAPEERTRAKEAIKLFDDAQQLIRTLDSNYQTHARVAILPAHSENDDIIVKLEQRQKTEQEPEQKQEMRIPLLRQQHPDEHGVCLCLSDFIRPKDASTRTDEQPYSQIGIFVCAADHAIEQIEAQDDYQHMLHQTVADRLAEATAEKMHETVRKEIWGYAPDEQFTVEDCLCEKYQGKRPAVGYPSLPDQSLNFVLDKIIDFSAAGVTLTENGAMRPHASTSGLMLAHPSTCHFSVGDIGDDQLKEYAQRRGMSVDSIRKFLV